MSLRWLFRAGAVISSTGREACMIRMQEERGPGRMCGCVDIFCACGRAGGAVGVWTAFIVWCVRCVLSLRDPIG